MTLSDWLNWLVTSAGLEAAITVEGVDRVLGRYCTQPLAANPASETVVAILTAVAGQAHNLRPPQPLDQPGYILRQLWMQSAELF